MSSSLTARLGAIKRFAPHRRKRSSAVPSKQKLPTRRWRTARWFDPLQPAPQNNGLNSNYEYIGESSDYTPGNALWRPDRKQPLTCSSR
jgi:hypothetical protein